jgi:hypothetical protein
LELRKSAHNATPSSAFLVIVTLIAAAKKYSVAVNAEKMTRNNGHDPLVVEEDLDTALSVIPEDQSRTTTNEGQGREQTSSIHNKLQTAQNKEGPRGSATPRGPRDNREEATHTNKGGSKPNGGTRNKPTSF